MTALVNVEEIYTTSCWYKNVYDSTTSFNRIEFFYDIIINTFIALMLYDEYFVWKKLECPGQKLKILEYSFVFTNR